MDYNLAAAHVAALTQCDVNTVIIDVRLIHDKRQDVPAIPMRGTLVQLWPSIQAYNAAFYGAFINIADMDGNGRETGNVRASRCFVVDLDKLDAPQQLAAASAFKPSPSFAIHTSENKAHVYWQTPYFKDDAFFTDIQRRLITLFNGDIRVVDSARVLRLAGTMHNKGAPQLVTCTALAGYGFPVDLATMQSALATVQPAQGATGDRHALGTPELQAPSLEWLEYALSLIDPNDLDRGAWISVTSATKQAGYSYGEQSVRELWEKWCARYAHNDVGENTKQFNSIRSTSLGWKSLVYRIPHLRGLSMFGPSPAAMQMPDAAQLQAEQEASQPASAPGAPPIPTSEILTDIECRTWFKGCMFVTNIGEILTPDNRFLNSGQFNAVYGGRKFIIDGAGKTTDEAWKAATRSTLYQIPKVDHIRFIPTRAYGEIVADDMGRKGVNMFRAPNVRSVAGDPTPFLSHITAMLPEAGDQRIILDYLAHNVKFPGHKIPWAPVIQSVEGVGKGLIKLLMIHCMGRSYTHFPNAHELANSGSTFNAWMRNKTFILADEIKVDDRRDMIEVLKPMISEEIIEVQGKGADQELEDNFSNWCFFTNWHDAIPVNRNGRRFAIMYSAMQSIGDLLAAGMDDPYFKALYDWMKADGAAIVAHYLLQYPIERGAIPMRAPTTSSTSEAVRLSRGPVERTIADAVEDATPGFRGGYVSTLSVARKLKETGKRSMGDAAVENILRSMGYTAIGRAPRPYFQEVQGGDMNARGYLFALDPRASVEHFAAWQGWGEV